MVSDTTQLPKVQQVPLQTSINIQTLHKLLSKNVKKIRYNKGTVDYRPCFFIIELIYLLYKVYNGGQNRYIIGYNKGTISIILRKKLWFLMFYKFFFQNPIDINEIGCIIKV